jgi:hypothetical protein
VYEIPMRKADSMPATIKRKPWFTVRPIVPGLVVIVVGWFVVRYFVGLHTLGYVDSAIVTMRTLVADEDKFPETHPSLGYTSTLGDISTDPAIASGRKNGYIFEISVCLAKAVGGPNTSYRVIARPWRSEMPAFCSDETGILKADYDGSIMNCVKSGQPL